MPVETTLQESHYGYIRAVAAALTQAGISVTDVDFLEDVWDDGEPIRCAHLHLARLATMQVYGVREVRADWTEEQGWTLHIAAPGSPFEVTHPLCEQVLPTPADLVTAVRAALAELPELTGRPHPAYRSYNDHDDAFEAQLDAYTKMAWMPVKVLQVEAVMPDGVVHGKQLVEQPATPAAVLEFFERQVMEVVRRAFPGAAEYRSWGWRDTQVQVPEEGIG
ncbi:DUF6292 family protein [Streptomyces sp. NPDC086782]|uniref:DUF6292 family protein n=1 Tax=Streptomyces sp. NPDC086782 TaxID=3365757 RepID=UPI0037F18B32